MPDISEHIYCKNTSVSALLAYFAQIAESSGIEYKVSADIPDDIKIDITDLSVLSEILSKTPFTAACLTVQRIKNNNQSKG